MLCALCVRVSSAKKACQTYLDPYDDGSSYVEISLPMCLGVVSPRVMGSMGVTRRFLLKRYGSAKGWALRELESRKARTASTAWWFYLLFFSTPLGIS